MGDAAEDAVVDEVHGFELVFRGSPEEVKTWLHEQRIVHSTWYVVTGAGIKNYVPVFDYMNR